MKDLTYLKGKTIAVLGAGAVGKTVAADCVLGGNKVNICDLMPYAEKTLFALEKTGIEITGEQTNLFAFHRSGKAFYNMVTTSIEECVKGCGIVIVAVPAMGHKVFFEKLIPVLEDGMIVHIIPDNYGTMVLRKMMREADCKKNIIVGGWSSAPYGCRVMETGGVNLPMVKIAYRAITLRGAALPSKNNETFLKSIDYLACFDAITKGQGAVAGETVMDIGFSNINPVLHCPGTILGVGVMENWGILYGGNDKKTYSIYSHAYCKSIAEVQYAFYKEEIELAEIMGVGIQKYEKKKFFSRVSVLGAEYMGEDYEVPYSEQYYRGMGSGPHTIYNRYITEDIPVGCHIYHLLGKKFDVQTRIIDSMINLACAMTGIDFYKDGMTLEDIGIHNMKKEEMLVYLKEGMLYEDMSK